MIICHLLKTWTPLALSQRKTTAVRTFVYNTIRIFSWVIKRKRNFVSCACKEAKVRGRISLGKKSKHQHADALIGDCRGPVHTEIAIIDCLQLLTCMQVKCGSKQPSCSFAYSSRTVKAGYVNSNTMTACTIWAEFHKTHILCVLSTVNGLCHTEMSLSMHYCYVRGSCF